MSDTHFGPSRTTIVAGANTFERASLLVERILQLPIPIDFVLHTGDVTNDPSREAYAIAEEVFSRLSCDRYFVPGNHDSSDMIARFLSQGAKRNLCEGEHYAFERAGIKFISLDATGDSSLKGRGRLSGEVLESLERELSTTKCSTIVAVHFPAVRFFSPWIDSDMSIINGEELHNVLSRYRDVVRAVLLGHVHQHFSVLHDGILYSSSGAVSFPLRSWCTDTGYQREEWAYPSFQVVVVGEGSVSIQPHQLRVPMGSVTQGIVTQKG